METKLKKQASQLRCYQCGSPEVKTVCHHCGRPMCAEHGFVTPKVSLFTENREFLNLNLGEWPLNKSNGAHCEFHKHASINFRRIMIIPGVIFLIIGIVLAISTLSQLVGCVLNLPETAAEGIPAVAEALRDPSVYGELPLNVCYEPFLINHSLDFFRSLVLAFVSLLVVFFGWRFNKEKVSAELTGLKTDLPVGLVSDAIEITETLTAELTLDEENKSTATLKETITGEILPEFRFTNQDIQRLDRYVHKYGMSKKTDVNFQAGFLALDGKPYAVFETDQRSPENSSDPSFEHINLRNLFRLQGAVQDYPYLTGGRGRSNNSFPARWFYTLRPKSEHLSPHNGSKSSQEWVDVPLRILPMLVQMGNIRSLLLQIQFNQAAFPLLKPTPEKTTELGQHQVLMLELAQVWVDPEQLGRPKSKGAVSEVNQTQDSETKRFYQVEWRNLYYQIQPGVNFIKLDEISFDQTIPEGAHLRGKLRLKVPASYSGIGGVRYFSPLGHAVAAKENNVAFPCRLSTYLNITFDLALAGLELTSMETLSCKPIEYAGAPNPTRVRTLLDALNSLQHGDLVSDSLYVRNVVESTPQIGEQEADNGRWQWDISGRYTRDMLPVDFHIVIYGHGDQNNGMTRIDSTVQGQIIENANDRANPFGESRMQLEQARDTIYAVLLETLQNEKQEGEK